MSYTIKGFLDKELEQCFKNSIKIEKELKRLDGYPTTGYDYERRMPYINYPNGEREYIGKDQLEILVFAGPNGSGKTTFTCALGVSYPYVNADDIKAEEKCSDLEAAQKAENLRNKYVDEGVSFTFETVLSTDRNLNLLKRAKEKGYIIKCIYVLTADSAINICRVKFRVATGGHDVPKDKIISRYDKALKLVPELLQVCDLFYIFDNSDDPFMIFKKDDQDISYNENFFWNKKQIAKLVGGFTNEK